MKLLEKLETPRRKYVKEEFALIIMFLLIIALFFSRPEVIGYASTNIHNQNINLFIDNSQVFYLQSIFPTPVHLTSLMISGEISGTGTASIYLDNEDGYRVLVFNNQKRAGSKINQITGTGFAGSGAIPGSSETLISGLSVTADALPMKDEEPALELIEGNTIPGFDALPAGKVPVEGLFNSACIESCLLQGDFFNKQRFKLVFYIEPGTTLRVTELTYTTLEEV